MSTPHQRILADSGSQELATLAIETARKKNSFCLIRALSHQVNLIGSILFLGENLLIKKKLLWVRLYYYYFFYRLSVLIIRDSTGNLCLSLVLNNYLFTFVVLIFSTAN